MRSIIVIAGLTLAAGGLLANRLDQGTGSVAKPAPQLYGYDGRLHLEQTREKIRLNSQISNMFA